MSSEAHSWQQIAGKLRRALGLCPPTPAEADGAIREAGEIPMSAAEIESIVESATSGEVRPAAFYPDHSWVDQVDTGSMAEDSMFVMNRNPGEEDEQVDQEVERLRQEALEDDDDEDRDNNKDGTAGRGTTP